MVEKEIHCYLDHLTNLGFKKTKTRVALVDAIANRPGAFSAKDIHGSLPSELDISFSTVYRNLQVFSDCGILHAIGSEGRFVSCSAGDDSLYNHARHTLYRCFSCAEVQESVEDIDKASLAHSGPLANVESSVTEVVGQCQKCTDQ